MPTVTVLMPVFNAMPYLKEACESLLAQTYRDYEILVFDDASTDGSAEYLDSIQNNRFRVIHSPKQGYASLLNQGLELTDAKYVARMDADDVCLPTRLERQIARMESQPNLVICGCQAITINGSGDPVGTIDYALSDIEIRHELLGTPPFLHPGVVYRTVDARAVGGYDPALVPAEDFDLWWRLAERGEMGNCPETLMKYRMHGKNISATRAVEQRHVARNIILTHLKRVRFARSHEEAEAFADFVEFRVPSSCKCPKYRHGLAALHVTERLIQSIRGERAPCIDEIAFVRRRLRWGFLKQAARCSWLDPARYQWFALATRADFAFLHPKRFFRSIALRACLRIDLRRIIRT
jgi:glycosyltransferase involved in cell wall biosynthesis